jgi:hypothetical protein
MELRHIRYFLAVAEERVLTDYAVSGSIRTRDSFDKLLRLVETGTIDLVIMESGDRLTPDLGDPLLDCFIERAFITWTRSRT